MFGIVFLLLALFLWISLLLTTIDKTMNSVCNNCFVIGVPEIFNPLNALLVVMSKVRPRTLPLRRPCAHLLRTLTVCAATRAHTAGSAGAVLCIRQYFPLDYILMVSLIAYFFFSTMAGLMKIGIRFLWITVRGAGHRRWRAVPGS